MNYKKPTEFKNRDELWEYMNNNNLVIVKGYKEDYFMDADDYYLGGAFDN